MIMTGAIDTVTMLATAAPLAADTTVLWRFLGRLHPMVVHFPLALIIVAAGLESLWFFRKGRGVSRTAMTCLVIGAAAAVLAAWLGWLNAGHEPRGQSVALTLALHRWIGIAAAGVACLALSFTLPARFHQRWAVHGYRWSLLIAAGLVSIGGFFGGELAHGRGYLVAVFRAPTGDPRPLPPLEAGDDAAGVAPIDFASQIRPIFAEHCSACHVPDRRRGDLVLIPISAAFARAPTEWVIQPGHPERSPMLTRVRLPADDPDRMPRDGDPLSDVQIALLARWIAQGATFGDAPPERSRQAVAPPARPAIDAATLQARDDAMAAIRDRGGNAVGLSEGGLEVSVNFRVAEPTITDTDLALLRGLEPCLTRLDLSRTAVTDAGVQQLLSFGRLARVRLDHTAITDAGVEVLSTLDALIWLNLVGTAVTDACVDAIARMAGLEQVYLGQTGVTATGASRLRRLRPGLEVVAGATALPAEPPREPADGGGEEKEVTNEPAEAVTGDGDPT